MKKQSSHEKKKKPRHIIGRSIAFIILLSLIISIEAFKIPLTAEQFTLRMEEAGFDVDDRTNSLEQPVTYLVADNGVFLVEFMEYKSTSEARTAVADIRSELEDLGDIVALLWSTSGFNSSYEQDTSDEQYARMRRIGRGILLINTTTDYEDEVAEIWEMLGQ